MMRHHRRDLFAAVAVAAAIAIGPWQLAAQQKHAMTWDDFAAVRALTFGLVDGPPDDLMTLSSD